MAIIIDFAVTVGSLTVTLLLFALVTGGLILAIEELKLRGYINKRKLVQWLKEQNVNEKFFYHIIPKPYKEYGPLVSTSVLALPYKQFVGIISSLIQADMRTDEPGSIANEFAGIGEKLCGVGPYFRNNDSDNPKSDDKEDKESRILFFAERALDDLQAYLAQQWAYARYGLAVISLVLVYGAIIITGFGIVIPLFVYLPMAIVSALFAPIFRDILEKLTGRQR